MTRRGTRLVAAAVLVTSLGVLGAVGAHGATVSSISARSGSLSATFTYSGSFPQSRDPWLTIRDAGRIVYRRAVTSPLCATSCWPEQFNAGYSALHVVALENNGQMDVVLDLYSGGAHCCSLEQVYSRSSRTAPFVVTERNFGDPGARLVRLGGGRQYYFVSADDTFAYAFTDYAASGLPLQIEAFSHQAFVDVTAHFPALIERDAASWLALYRSSASNHYSDSVGLIAAWAADEARLGRWSIALNVLEREARAGHLNSALAPIEPSGRPFVMALTSFLRRYHYVH